MLRFLVNSCRPAWAIPTVVGLFTSSGCLDSGGANPSSEETDCLEGTERCACFRNGTCDHGLTCLSEICVDPDSEPNAEDSGTLDSTATDSTSLNSAQDGSTLTDDVNDPAEPMGATQDPGSAPSTQSGDAAAMTPAPNPDAPNPDAPVPPEVLPPADPMPVAVCGDGVVSGDELCDDGNQLDGDGCSASCAVEPGMKCAGSPSVCLPSNCGDGVQEGAETCDDGNLTPFDGCSATCQVEPTCAADGSGCAPRCGDGLLNNEECDDGNQLDGDGCSSNCEVEAGFICQRELRECEQVGGNCVLRLPAIYRDHSATHPDFGPHPEECVRQVEETGELIPANAVTTGLVEPQLGPDGRPQLSVSPGMQDCEPGADKPSYAGITQFADWFIDSASVVTVPGELLMFEDGDGGFVNRFSNTGEQFEGYENEEWSENGAFTCSWCLDGSCIDRCDGDQRSFDGTPLFFPVDSVTGATVDLGEAKVPAEYGYTAWPWEADVFGTNVEHNFYFTSEFQLWFDYTDDTSITLDFTGDDDLWVFVNSTLAVDLGGIHVPEHGSVTINSSTAEQLGLVPGNAYPIAIFHADRRMEGSSFRLRIDGLSTARSECTAVCGDGILAPGEECDDGQNDGGPGECGPDCRLQ